MLKHNIPVTYCLDDMINEAVDLQMKQHPKGRIDSIVVFDTGEEVRVYFNTDPTRIRRITGYLSNKNNFNSAKKDELNDRQVHT